MSHSLRSLVVGVFVVALAATARPAAAAAVLRATLAGAELPLGAVTQIFVDQDRGEPEAATIVVEGREGLELANRLVIGDDAQIAVDAAQSTAALFKGEVVGIEPVFAGDGKAQVVILAFDRLHRLTREAKTRTFDDVSDAEIVALIAREHALAPQVSSAPEIRYDHVYQHNQTDLEFLRVRAALLDFDVWVEGTTLHFDQRVFGPPIALTPRPADDETRLEIFHAQLASSATLQKIVVRGWDPATGQQIVGSATARSILLDPDDPDPDALFGGVLDISVDDPIASTREADAIAKAKLEELMLSYMSAEAQAKGNPKLKAGIVVTLSGLDDRFNGNYLVSGATHKYSHGEGCDGGYATMFRQRREDLGLFRIPSIDDEVIVAFEHGDIDRPVIVGSLWNPDESCADGRDWPDASR